MREKIQDPAYSCWFLTFNGSGTYNVPQRDDSWKLLRCSNFYHDQFQTPEYPSDDESCTTPYDRGEGVPCGEYLFNLANGTMLIN